MCRPIFYFWQLNYIWSASDQVPLLHLNYTAHYCPHLRCCYISLHIWTRFFKGILGTRIGCLDLKIGSLESAKIIIRSLESEKIGFHFIPTKFEQQL